MKIFALRDETIKNKDLAYLFYYEKERRFYIEILSTTSIWEVPILLASFIEKRELSINSYWSYKWVSERITPSDRQNLAHILKDNKLNEYDEYKLLSLSKGRSSQDDTYIVPIKKEDLPKEIILRFDKYILDITPLSDFNLLIFFKDKTVKKCDIYQHFGTNPSFKVLFNNKDYFNSFNIEVDGRGIEWDINLNINASKLYEISEDINLNLDDFKSFILNNTVDVVEASKILDCTRQNIEFLTRTNKLKPIKSSNKNTLYLKGDILNRKWNNN